MQTKPLLVAALSAATILAPARGSDSDADQAIAVAEAWHHDVVTGDARAACTRVTDHAVEILVSKARDNELLFPDGASVPTTCEGLVTAVHKTFDAGDRRMLTEAHIERVRIHGDRAEIRDEDISFPPDLERGTVADEPALLVRTREGWKLDQVG